MVRVAQRGRHGIAAIRGTRRKKMRGSQKMGRRVLAAVLLALVLCVGAAGAAFAQTDPYSNETPTVKPSLIVRDSDPEPETGSSGILPFTGGDVTVLLLIGLASISLGTLVVQRTRRPLDRR
jgi:hypothetical protein